MKPHPRIRKTIKWGGAAVTVLLVVVWVGSGWFSVGWNGDEGQGAGISWGRIDFYKRIAPPPPKSRGFRFKRAETLQMGWSVDRYRDSQLALVGVPLWPVAAATFIGTAIAWRLDTLARRRAKLNICPKCGYDRTGLLQDAKCPECGAVPDARV